MEILPFLLGISVFIFFAAISFFFWNVNNGQYDDLESPAHHILFDDDDDLIPTEARQHNNTQPDKTTSNDTDDVR